MARSSKTTQTLGKPEEPAKLSNPGEPRSGGEPLLTGDGLPPEVLAQVLTDEDIYLSPQTLAAMTGLDEKWFAGAREGHKEVDGPPFRKLGTAKTAPVRYNLADVRKWWAQFPKQVTTHGKLSTFRSAADFFKGAAPESRWLFANVGGAPVDIVVALQGGAFDGVDDPNVAWLTFPEWIQQAWASPHLHGQITSLLRPLQEAALADHEQSAFEIEVRQASPGERRTIDDLPVNDAQAASGAAPEGPTTDRRL